MARKTNKTAHVLNLISKAKDEHQSMEDQMEIDNTGSDVSNDLLFMGIEPSNDKSISEKINENLESFVNQGEDLTVMDIALQCPSTFPSEVEQTQHNETQVNRDTPYTDKKTTQSPSTNIGILEAESPGHKASESEISAEPTTFDDSHIEQTNITAQSQSKDAQESTEVPVEPAFHYINVYESLVIERLEEFQKMFDVCTCPRCTADLIALTLTNLPAKYIVSDNSKTIPLLSFYREKFRTSVAAQLSSACIVIKQKPYH